MYLLRPGTWSILKTETASVVEEVKWCAFENWSEIQSFAKAWQQEDAFLWQKIWIKIKFYVPKCCPNHMLPLAALSGNAIWHTVSDTKYVFSLAHPVCVNTFTAVIKNPLFYVSYVFGLYYTEISRSSSDSAKLLYTLHCFSIIKELWEWTTCEIIESYMCTPREKVDEKAEGRV